jgi:hypothetical protein
MSETAVPRIQFEDGIKPVKSTGVSYIVGTGTSNSTSEKSAEYDAEAAQNAIADEDLNRKKKQVCSVILSYLCDKLRNKPHA